MAGADGEGYAHFLSSQKNVVAAQELHILSTKKDILTLKRHWRRTLLLAFLVVGALASIILADVLSLPRRYPEVFCWFDSVSKDLARSDPEACYAAPALFRAASSPYLMALAVSYPTASRLLNLFTIVPYTDPLRADFLMTVIARHSDSLTPVMLSGSPSQLSGRKGETLTADWLPVDAIYEASQKDTQQCADATTQLCPNVQDALHDSWRKSCESGNPFVNLFVGDICETQSVRDYVAACESDEGKVGASVYDSALYALFNEGLQGAAEKMATNGEDLYRYLFCPSNYEPEPYVSNCGADSALTGMEAGVGLGFPFAGVAMAIPEGAPFLVGLFLAASVATGVGGGIASGAAARKQCKESEPPPGGGGGKSTLIVCDSPNPNLRCAATEEATPRAWKSMKEGTCLPAGRPRSESRVWAGAKEEEA